MAGSDATGWGALRTGLARLGRALWGLPPWTQAPQVRLRPRLVTFVAAAWVIVVLIAVYLPWRGGDWVAAAVGGLLVAGMAAYAIPSLGGAKGPWSVSAFFHLAFTYAIGPPAIVAVAIGQGVGGSARRRPGWFRTVFNIAHPFLADTGAWFVFCHFLGGAGGPAGLALRGAAGAATEALINVAMVASVVSLSGQPSRPLSWLRQLVQQVGVSLLFGVTAAGATFLYTWEGTFGIITLLLPLAMVQGSLVVLARRTHEHARQQEEQARERERLLRSEARASRVAAAALQRASTAAEDERQRIAADLHDGVIQDVYGLFISAGALEMRLADEAGSGSAPEALREFVSYSKQVAAGASRDLRALMVELAPPLLDKEGLAAALRLVLARLDREGIAWVLDCIEDSMERRQQRLVHRVVLEAVRNIIKHARARQVWVTVRAVGDGLVASVRDDGAGFSPDTRTRRRQEGHAGLGLLERTVRDGGGRLSIQSAAGHGTTVTLVLPVLLSPADDDGDADLGEAPDEAAIEATFAAYQAAISGARAEPASEGDPGPAAAASPDAAEPPAAAGGAADEGPRASRPSGAGRRDPRAGRRAREHPEPTPTRP